ncbi:hypothetical protein ANANG_G00135180 [Anguilla anguilla]|uniref:Uncharacterized protein n=1 Tax=Anguilla anguilla TaxID=7936 RepID=A0A9D3MBH3_ANGAN|nr:hypothetical protein ANANG_G00135180 [Anguilla anguilla]
MSLPSEDMSKDSENCRRRSTADSTDTVWDPEPRHHHRGSMCDRLCVASMHPEILGTPSPSLSHQISLLTPRYAGQRRHSFPSKGVPGSEDVWEEAACKTTIRAENEVEAQKWPTTTSSASGSGRATSPPGPSRTGRTSSRNFTRS